MALTSGTLIFKPLFDAGNIWGVGALNLEGRFQVEPSRLGATFLPGSYAVYVIPPLVEDPETGRRIPRPGYPVAQKYLDMETPAMVVEVEPGQAKLDLNFEDD